MFKLKSLVFFIAALMLSFSTFSFASHSHGDHSQKNSLGELKGEYAYTLSGEFGPTSLSNGMVEIGVFISDGKGNLIFYGTSIVNGQPAFNVTYNGTYTVEDGIATAHVTRFSPSGQTQLTLLLAIANAANSVFIQVLPEPSTEFAFLNISGEGKKN